LAEVTKQIREFKRLLGKKVPEVEILRDAVGYGRAKQLIAHSSLLPGDDR
jgi:transposase